MFRDARMVLSGNIYANLPAPRPEEEATILAEFAGARVERIVSMGHASPPGFWCDQDWTEWVILLDGAAGLWIEGEGAPRTRARATMSSFRRMSATGWNGRDRPADRLARGALDGRGRLARCEGARHRGSKIVIASDPGSRARGEAIQGMQDRDRGSGSPCRFAPRDDDFGSS